MLMLPTMLRNQSVRGQRKRTRTACRRAISAVNRKTSPERASVVNRQSQRSLSREVQAVITEKASELPSINRYALPMEGGWKMAVGARGDWSSFALTPDPHWGVRQADRFILLVCRPGDKTNKGRGRFARF